MLFNLQNVIMILEIKPCNSQYFFRLNLFGPTPFTRPAAHLVFVLPRLLINNIQLVQGIFQQNPSIHVIMKPSFLNLSKSYNRKKLKWNVNKLLICKLKGFNDTFYCKTPDNSSCYFANGCAHNVTLSTIEALCRHYHYMTLIGHNTRTLKPFFKSIFPQHKVLDVIRDPRQILAERVDSIMMQYNLTADHPHVNDIYFVEVNRLSLMCMELKEDVQSIRALQVKSTVHYKILRYEDIYGDRYTFSKLIYKFLNMPYHQNVTNWIKQTLVSHYIPTSISWVGVLPHMVIRDIEIVCSDIMDEVGYKRVHSADLEQIGEVHLMIPARQLNTSFVLL